MHTEDPFDAEANIFNETMMAFGLTQHVTSPTHNRGNILNLIFSELGDAIQVGIVQSGLALSDHLLVHASLSVKKQSSTRDKITIRKFTVITDEMLNSEFNDEIPFDDEDLNTLIAKLEMELK